MEEAGAPSNQGVYGSNISVDGDISESRTRTPIDLFTDYLIPRDDLHCGLMSCIQNASGEAARFAVDFRAFIDYDTCFERILQGVH
jgi:hypothetical protein